MYSQYIGSDTQKYFFRVDVQGSITNSMYQETDGLSKITDISIGDPRRKVSSAG